MSDEQFRQLCNVFGFAPSRSLRELIDCVRAQEIEACVKAVETGAQHTATVFEVCADVIRARKDKQ